MMFTADVDGINEMLHVACDAILKTGEHVEVRGYNTWELRPAIFTISDPTDRTLLYPHRGNNPFASLFETIWVLGSEDNNIETLAKFIPRAKDYSDDGKTWRAGYPNRLRRFGINRVDQIDYVFKKLREDESSRQAIISMWSPAEDDFDGKGELQKSTDFPCSNYLQFMIRNDKLDCMFVIRSNDAIFGMSGINVYEFTVLQEILASLLKVDIGNFYYIAGSLHLYEEHKEKALKLSKHIPFDYMLPKFEFACPAYLWTDYQKKMANACLYITKDVVPINELDGKNFAEMVKLCQAFLVYKDRDASYFKAFCKDMGRIRFSDLHVACMYWFMKHWKLIDDVTKITSAIECSNANNNGYIQQD